MSLRFGRQDIKLSHAAPNFYLRIKVLQSKRSIYMYTMTVSMLVRLSVCTVYV